MAPVSPNMDERDANIALHRGNQAVRLAYLSLTSTVATRAIVYFTVVRAVD